VSYVRLTVDACVCVWRRWWMCVCVCGGGKDVCVCGSGGVGGGRVQGLGRKAEDGS
jgi:hypothetical protein